MGKSELFIQIAPNVQLHTVICSPRSVSHSPAILLLHFWGGSNATFDATIAGLGSEHAIIAPSLRGWGQSSAPDDDAAYRIADYADDIESLIKQLQRSQSGLLSNGLVLVGHSMGGKIAQYLLTLPEIKSLVKGMVLIAPALAGSFSLPDDMREQQMHAYDSEESARFVMENVLLGKPDAIAPEVKDSTAKIASSGSRGARQAWPSYGMAEDYQAEVMRVFQDKRLEGQALKIRVMVGELDRIETPENVEARVVRPLVEAGAEVGVEKVQKVGHLIPLETPSQLASLIGGLMDTL